MSDMELSAPGEDGDGSEDYSLGEVILHDSAQQSISIQTSHFHRQGENHVDKVHNMRRDSGEHRRMVDITRDKPVKVTVRVVVPVRDHPKFNFVGKLLGPKGNSLKRLQEDTMTKMAILGRGSMRDKHKEEELRLSGDPKFSHLHDDLHVEITAFAPPAEAHARIAYALADVRRFLVPDYNDDIRQEQMWEMQILKERPDNTAVVDPPLGVHVLGTAMPVVPQGHEAGSPNSTHSPGSQSPQTSPSGGMDGVGPPILLAAQHSVQHPALRGVPVPTVKSPVPVVAPNLGAVPGRKRPLLPGTRRHVLSPTKRTVMSILARARAAQAKDIPGYHVNGNAANLMGIRHDGTLIGAANLV